MKKMRPKYGRREQLKDYMASGSKPTRFKHFEKQRKKQGK
jgi:hypothetical protein